MPWVSDNLPDLKIYNVLVIYKNLKIKKLAVYQQQEKFVLWNKYI